MNLNEKIRQKIERDTSIEVLEIRKIKRGKLSKSNTWAFVVITKSGQNIGSMCTITELVARKSRIEIISNSVSFDEFI